MIKTVSVDIDLEPYKVKWVVAFNHDWLIDYVDWYGLNELEEDKVFVICFDTTPLDKINSMLNYRDVVARYPDSHRILHESVYIGNHLEEDWLKIVHQQLQHCSSPLWRVWTREVREERDDIAYEIVAMEDGFTRMNKET